ncbi:DUF4258 domain-containing protein [Candidatus Gottesmanbacteria bacterium]|nr:DUF4258 domain-containing protein [Candidatus Gottesmanbacteria bacterium]MBI5452411.1 DUF4258 domain-containing protein [Candidatus Gottesmanbacteria bacterium]
MKFIYTSHAEEKLTEREPKKLGIDKRKIQEIVQNPEVIDESDKPVLMAIGELDNDHSLCVIYRYIQERILIITFFPAKKGRYELKILSR